MFSQRSINKLFVQGCCFLFHFLTVSHTEIQNKRFTKDRLSSSLVGQYFSFTLVLQKIRPLPRWLFIFLLLMDRGFCIFCPFLARHEVFISSLAGIWRQNEGKRWASSNHWGKFILHWPLLGYYHGTIRHITMNQIPGSELCHRSQMMAMDSTGILLNPRYFTLREASWGNHILESVNVPAFYRTKWDDYVLV